MLQMLGGFDYIREMKLTLTSWFSQEQNYRVVNRLLAKRDIEYLEYHAKSLTAPMKEIILSRPHQNCTLEFP